MGKGTGEMSPGIDFQYQFRQINTWQHISYPLSQCDQRWCFFNGIQRTQDQLSFIAILRKSDRKSVV